MNKVLSISLLFYIILISCEKNKDEFKRDWINASGKLNTSDLTTIYMLNDETGFVGGFSNINIKGTSNHYFDNFQDSVVLKPNDFYYIDHEFEDTTELKHCLFKTTNGRDSWIGISTPFKIGALDIHFVNERIGYVASDEEGVYKTIDGGKSWTTILSNMVHYYYGNAYINPFKSVTFIDELTGFAYDNSGISNLVVKTKDGGVSWSVVSMKYAPGINGKYPTLFDNLQEIVFPNLTDTGYAITMSKLYKTIDRGETWDLIYDKGEVSNFNVAFNNAQIFYLVNDHKITMDGGMSWKSMDMSIDNELVNKNLLFYYSSGHDIIRFIPGIATYYMSSEINIYIKDMLFTPNNVGYAIGGSYVLKYAE